jgi:UDP-glucose:(heptosyl)LPS alpha-1,3-glucosyltransferase
MKLAFCLFRYFPFGGMQRDFLRIANICLARGHSVEVYTWDWEGEKPDELNVLIIPIRGLTNHKRRESFSKKVGVSLAEKHYDAVVGFNKMPYLDVYFAADTCYVERSLKRSVFYRMTKRCRSNLLLERAVFDRQLKTEILAISNYEKSLYMKHYGTDEKRFHYLPPGISNDRLAPPNADEIRSDLRRELKIGDDDNIILMVGTDYRRKGVDRAIRAMASLPHDLYKKTYLLTVGKDKIRPFQRLARRLNVTDQIRFLGGREDVPRFLVASDILLHPAYEENTGTVLIEALASHLPALVTEVCGYSFHIERANAGKIVPAPFKQETLNELLVSMLTSDKKTQWRRNARDYFADNDLFSLSEKAADVIEQVASC